MAKVVLVTFSSMTYNPRTAYPHGVPICELGPSCQFSATLEAVAYTQSTKCRSWLARPCFSFMRVPPADPLALLTLFPLQLVASTAMAIIAGQCFILANNTADGYQ